MKEELNKLFIDTCFMLIICVAIIAVIIHIETRYAYNQLSREVEAVKLERVQPRYVTCEALPNGAEAQLKRVKDAIERVGR